MDYIDEGVSPLLPLGSIRIATGCPADTPLGFGDTGAEVAVVQVTG